MRTGIIFCALLLTLAFIAEAASKQPYLLGTDSAFKHIEILSSDSLEGREVGEIGEWKAAQYIRGVFERSGLEPAGTVGYWQPFEFIKRIELGPLNRLAINGRPLLIDSEYVPLEHSASSSFEFAEIVPVDYGIRTEDSAYDDYADKVVQGKAVLIKRFVPPADRNPHVDFSKYSSFADKIRIAIDLKAAGIFFVTPASEDDTLMSFAMVHVTPRNIPIIFLKRRALERLGIDLDSPTIASASGQTELIPVQDTGYNVLGLLKGTSDTTIVIGAHYDHLGWGGPASRHTGAGRVIHPGADDNASGTSGLLEVVRYFSSQKETVRHSLLFAAFSGEEAGILGSGWFVRHWTIDSSTILMMLNMDMVGRLKDQEHGLAIFGVGTAAEFKPYFDNLKLNNIKVSFLEPGTGPSDHTAFYNSGIPVLHFFTGAHTDYHKPSDTPDKIDSQGLVRVISLVSDIVTHFDSASSPLTFQRTKDPEEGKRRAQYKVTLGIMPDYTAKTKGVRVDGVTADRPAERAGIRKGDIIVRLGEIAIDDIYSYMSALSKFNRGDSTTAVVVRTKDTLNLPVVF